MDPFSERERRKKLHQRTWNHISAANRKLESEIQQLRVLRINAVMDEMERCRAGQGLGAQIGELDQLSELHRLLYLPD